MDLQDHRMACLRMAFELQGKHDHILHAANQMMAFVTTGEMPAPAPVAAMPDTAADDTSDDVIAHCGTALEMPESGDLADAALPAAPAEAVVESAAPALPDETPPTAHEIGALVDETPATDAAGPPADGAADDAASVEAAAAVDEGPPMDAPSEEEAPSAEAAPETDDAVDGAAEAPASDASAETDAAEASAATEAAEGQADAVEAASDDAVDGEAPAVEAASQAEAAADDGATAEDVAVPEEAAVEIAADDAAPAEATSDADAVPAMPLANGAITEAPAAPAE